MKIDNGPPPFRARSPDLAPLAIGSPQTTDGRELNRSGVWTFKLTSFEKKDIIALLRRSLRNGY